MHLADVEIESLPQGLACLQNSAPLKRVCTLSKLTKANLSQDGVGAQRAYYARTDRQEIDAFTILIFYFYSFSSRGTRIYITRYLRP